MPSLRGMAPYEQGGMIEAPWIPILLPRVLSWCPITKEVLSKLVVAHVAQLGTGFRITFARMQRTIRHLDFRTPNLRTRRSVVRITAGAPPNSWITKTYSYCPRDELGKNRLNSPFGFTHM